MAEQVALGTGRRKKSIARVYLKKGKGAININGKALDEYFVNPTLAYVVKQPIAVTDLDKKVDIQINVKGGGITGQAGACRHGIARALVQLDETNLSSLRKNGFLTRDPRMVERKKYGQRGARKKYQFSKR